MNNYDYYLNTWGYGCNLKVKAHIVNEFNRLIDKVLFIESKDLRLPLPQNWSIPLKIKRRDGQMIEATVHFENRWWFLRIQVEN